MRKLTKVLLTVTLIGAYADAYAHGGGLDSAGCHHDLQRGGYHCHSEVPWGRILGAVAILGIVAWVIHKPGGASLRWDGSTLTREGANGIGFYIRMPERYGADGLSQRKISEVPTAGLSFRF